VRRRGATRSRMRYHDAPESRAGRRRSRRIVDAFVAAAAPRATVRQRTFAAELVFMTVTAVGKQVSERRPSEAAIDRWADAIADMLTTHLARLAPHERRAPRVGTAPQRES
jgi:hypothetical protein